MLEGMTIDKKPLKDHLEAIGHRDAFLFVQQQVEEKEPITESIIKQIHTLVLMDKSEDRGVYRRVSVRIVGAATEPPQPYLVPVQMEAFLRKIKTRRGTPLRARRGFICYSKPSIRLSMAASAQVGYFLISCCGGTDTR